LITLSGFYCSTTILLWYRIWSLRMVAINKCVATHPLIKTVLDQVSISSMIFAQILCMQIPKLEKRLTTWLSFFVLLGSAFVKAAHRTFMKLTPGVNFINIFCTAFVPAGPKSIKRHWQNNWNFKLLGSAWVKALCRTLMKLTPAIYKRISSLATSTSWLYTFKI